MQKTSAKPANLKAVADEAFAPLQDAVDLDMPTEAEVDQLTEWKRYRVALACILEQADYPRRNCLARSAGLILPNACLIIGQKIGFFSEKPLTEAGGVGTKGATIYSKGSQMCG
ncbi:tail fiber assembly protein [Pseudomonas urmiensis]|uniref:tail fiber assembly protein n=1 Tax=Pseudomonas urmiensis TaxID=2745493 RepID=UPI003C9FAD97